MNEAITRKKRPRVVKSFKGIQSKAKQSFKAEADINNIMAKYVKTGIPPEAGRRQPMYGDFSNGENYQDTLNKVIQAKNAFALLDSKIRERFNQDPAEVLDFLANPENHEEAVEIGLIAAEEAAAEPEPAAAPAPEPERGPEPGSEPGSEK